ncbi:hypothetical protein Rsub_03277 [Raphidocelis subcapitata]|uniref:Bifunctional inhibitor/plant lipid transfer protein/seed storage helical domain-containing protein n=1 Tax=Raphidocelis subcapitata TaxID=307507 RepID=A0A2V0NR78_9CHLO|nr:hypothetical protein Rsub_03277 [Raphidocelis subcapitata]|eukprot:GBF90144.1 hypothetical protein Rsub_03277 [Raphidocelis subcapitata]
MQPPRRSRAPALAGPLLLALALAAARAQPAPAAPAAPAAAPAAPAAAPAAAPDLSQLPPACLDAGSKLQGSCSAEFGAADSFFAQQGVNTTGAAAGAPPALTEAQLEAYVKQAPRPSDACCAAARAFNDAGCSCDAGVLSLAVQFTGNNPQLYETVAKGFATACDFPIQYGSTCPAGAGAGAGAPAAAASPAPAPAAAAQPAPASGRRR